MPLLIRIDVDRPYGRAPLYRHVLSRLTSDYGIPTVGCFGYLQELRTLLSILNAEGAQAYVFFRRCTLPSVEVLELIDRGKHSIGLHLENSRSFLTFKSEKQLMESRTGRSVACVSKHGSGHGRFGLHHHPPYEPEKYADWANRVGMTLFLGNLEDPTIPPFIFGDKLIVFPAAFWLEPHWRDTRRFSVDWLLDQTRDRDIVLLVHPENVLGCPDLTTAFHRIIRNAEPKITSAAMITPVRPE